MHGLFWNRPPPTIPYLCLVRDDRLRYAGPAGSPESVFGGGGLSLSGQVVFGEAAGCYVCAINMFDVLNEFQAREKSKVEEVDSK